MYFVSLAIFLTTAAGKVLSIGDSIYAHAAILKVLTKADPAIGSFLHDMQRNKHFSLGIVESRRGMALLRVSFMGHEALTYAHLLIDALIENGKLQIGQTACEITGVTIENGPWSGISTRVDITVPSLCRLLRFYFATPTAIVKRGDRGQRISSVLPEPHDVFSGLARRWHALGGPLLPDNLGNFLRSGGCVISNLDLQTVEFRTPERTQIGFVGTVVYTCSTSSQPHLAALQALTRLAFFSGVGYQTARGMGLIQTTIG